MCFVIPQQIIKSNKNKANTSEGRTLDSSLVSVQKGDWVLEQNGLIIARISSRNAQSILKLIEENAPLKS